MGGLTWTTAVFLVVVTVGGTTLLLRRPDDNRLMRLSLLACLAALAFAPLLRAVPDEVSFLLFFVGLWPTLAVVAISTVASAVRAIQTRSLRALPSLILSVLAAGLFYVNIATSWIWPYKTY